MYQFATSALFVCCFVITFSRVCAQYEPQLSHYFCNPTQYNAAYAGAKDGIEFLGVHRSQYVGLTTRATATQFLAVHLPVYTINSGLGLSIVNDLIGYQRSTYINMQYAYHAKLKAGIFSIGASVGLVQVGLQGDRLTTPGGNYQNGVNHNDDRVPAALQNGVAPDFSAALRWGNDKYHLGVSFNHLYSQAKLGVATMNYSRYFAFVAAYKFNLGKKFALTPSSLIKSDLKKVQAELTLMSDIGRNILAGVAFRGYEGRSVDAAVLYLGVTFKGFRVLYSYDANVSYLTKFNMGSHEVSLAYLLPMKRRLNNSGYYYHNARFL